MPSTSTQPGKCFSQCVAAASVRRLLLHWHQGAALQGCSSRVATGQTVEAEASTSNDGEAESGWVQSFLRRFAKRHAALPAACTGMRHEPPPYAASRADHADIANDGESRLLCQLHSKLWQVELLLPAQHAMSQAVAAAMRVLTPPTMEAGIAAEASHRSACAAPETAPAAALLGAAAASAQGTGYEPSRGSHQQRTATPHASPGLPVALRLMLGLLQSAAAATAPLSSRRQSPSIDRRLCWCTPS